MVPGYCGLGHAGFNLRCSHPEFENLRSGKGDYSLELQICSVAGGSPHTTTVAQGRILAKKWHRQHCIAVFMGLPLIPGVLA